MRVSQKVLKRAERLMTVYRVISVSCDSRPSSFNPRKFDSLAVQMLKDWGFKNPDPKAKGDWYMFDKASAACKSYAFYVGYCSPSLNNPWIKIPTVRQVFSDQCPGYFYLEQFDQTRRHGVTVDIGYAKELNYNSETGQLFFKAKGLRMAEWKFWCQPVDKPLPEEFIVILNRN